MMLGTGGFEQVHKVPSSPSSSRHNHPQRHQISRSISELSPIHIHRHGGHHHHHHSHSRSRRDGRHERASDRAGDESIHHAKTAGGQSAVSATYQPRTSLEVPRSEGAAADTSPGTLTSADQSRRTSALIASGDEGQMMGATDVYTRKLSRDEELAEERRRAGVRASGLQKSLAELTSFSNTTTRRLDDSYYSVLSKTGTLQNTIAALKELALLSQVTGAQFEKESDDLDAETQSQISAFGNFEAQEKRIRALTERIHGGRDKVRSLSDRVDVVRERIEKWERADREWQERTRRRLKAVWVVISVLMVVVMVVVVGVQYVPNGEVLGRNGSVVIGGGQGVMDGDRGQGIGSVLASMNRSRQGSVDERLRVFDEL
ncbi:hypothetical protein GE09DRAFT_1139846 [Coniochaeta sp. 2T2.1]|nr:hypothetical protein GE09DRAFT_1139846 [Coniochaeta sp. 2T2.1]